MSSPLHSIPLEIRRKIFLYCRKQDLMNFVQCSKFWKSELVPMLWRVISIAWKELGDGHLSTKITNLKHTQKFSFAGMIGKQRKQGCRSLNFVSVIQGCDSNLLKQLELSFIPNDVVLDMIPRFQNLEEVLLIECGVTDDHVRKICLLKNLKVLKIPSERKDEMTPTSLDYISKVTGLQALYFNPSDEIRNHCFSNALTKLTNLTKLELPVDGLSDFDDAFCITVGRALKFLEVLNICGSVISDEGLASLLTLRNLTSLSISGADDNPTNISDQGLAAIYQLTKLEKFHIAFSNIGDAGITHVSRLLSLKSLDIFSCQNVTDAGLKMISKLHNLECLDISINSNYTDEGFAHLKNLELLRVLYMTHLDITDASLDVLAKLVHLKELYIEYCDELSSDGLERLSSDFPNLDHLECDSIYGTSDDESMDASF